MELCHRAYKSSPLRRGHDLVKEQETQLIKSISNTDDIDVYQAIYHYLVWNEYFSAENKFVGFSTDIIELTSESTIAIASENGCYRNFTCHLKKINEFNRRSFSINISRNKIQGEKRSRNEYNGIIRRR